MNGRIAAHLAELGIVLPAAPAPLANYVPYVVTGNLVVISGQLPTLDGKLGWVGKLGEAVSIEDGQRAARQCFLNLLAQLSAACGGDLDRVGRVVRLGGFVAAGPDFIQQAQVMNGASDAAVEIFGEAGRHARYAVGVSSLPANAPIEVEGMFELLG